MKALFFLALVLDFSLGLNNGLALTPQLAWNSWNAFHCDINEKMIKSTIDLMVTTGLQAAGYQYVNVDDCWANTRTKEGVITTDPVNFPHGMKALADYAHSKGLLFGLYSDAGFQTCAGRPGSLGYETIDAFTYAAWGVDYLKYDNCNNDGSIPEIRYPVMRDALNSTGVTIFFSMCEWGVDNPATWAPVVGNSWRTTGDIDSYWDSIMSNMDKNEPLWKYAGPGGWNDPDMLEVGNGQLTYNESVAHFSLWSIMKSPLIIGCDLTTVTNETLTILTNSEVIAVNQDPLGIQGHRVNVNGNSEVWSGQLENGKYAGILFNRDNVTTVSITAQWSDLGLPNNSNYTVRDLWAHKNLGSFTNSFTATISPHSLLMILLTPQ
jgi:alpha-galactosidase